MCILWGISIFFYCGVFGVKVQNGFDVKCLISYVISIFPKYKLKSDILRALNSTNSLESFAGRTDWTIRIKIYYNFSYLYSYLFLQLFKLF